MLIEKVRALSESTIDDWKDLFEGDDANPPTTDPNDRRPRPPGAAPGLVPNDEDGDREHPNHRPGRGANRIQHEITSWLDTFRTARIRRELHDRGRISDLPRAYISP